VTHVPDSCRSAFSCTILCEDFVWGTPCFHGTKRRAVRIDATPEPIAIDTVRTMALVVDKQNDFRARGACSTVLD
jgi:hypothetical protein